MVTNSFITRTFFNIYDSVDAFKTDAQSLIGTITTEPEQEELYYMIAGIYGDSNVRYTNEALFKLNLFNNIKIFYPKVLAFIRDQKRLRDADSLEFQKSGKMVINAGAHNTANISTDTDQGINQLDSQQISNNIRGEFSVLLDRLNAYRAGEEDKFLKGLNPLFVQIIAPMADLLYGTEIKEEE